MEGQKNTAVGSGGSSAAVRQRARGVRGARGRAGGERQLYRQTAGGNAALRGGSGGGDRPGAGGGAHADAAGSAHSACPSGDTAALLDACLTAADGVQAAWAVTVGGERAGIVTDPSALGEAVESILAQGAVDGAVSAELSEEIQLTRVFIPRGQADDLMDVARSIRERTRVVSHTADGTVRYG